ncbi:MAG: thiamine phosphate synthase [Candidatus Azobacteroides sp.]|nr:thiamine phosphate synthase [Candidatus Azobacteroides sp.]
MLQFITHANRRYNYLQSAEIALQGGCKWIQLRMKEVPEEMAEAVALNVRALCKQHDATFIVDDHVGLTKRIKADGVHLGKSDMPPAEARKILGGDFIIGGTANTFEDIERLVDAGVDYIGLGPFRFTETKKNLSPILGLNGYREIIRRCRERDIRLPIVAIGGITYGDIPDILHTGVAGIALSSTILNADNPVEETKRIINLCGDVPMGQ